MAKILESRNYRQFELFGFNRDVKRVQPLMESMKKHGWIDAYPMNVQATGNGKLLIKDGHHRFAVAQQLGIPVKYVICSDKATVYELDKPTNKWNLEDHLSGRCREGKIEYIKVREYCHKTGISTVYAAAMLSGRQAGTSGDVSIRFKDGTFQCKNTAIAEGVGDIVVFCKQHGVPWAHHSLFVQALSRVCLVSGFSITRMKNKIKSFPYLLEKKPHIEGNLEMLEELYNYKSQQKVPLKFLADQEARERSIIKK